MSVQTHKICELYPGVFYTILDFPDSSILPNILSPDIEYVVFWNFYSEFSNWEPLKLPLTKAFPEFRVRAMNSNCDFVMRTSDFLELLPSINQGINIAQIAELPPQYFDFRRIHGKERYKQLRMLGWHFECGFRPDASADYGEIWSCNRSTIEKAIHLVESMK